MHRSLKRNLVIGLAALALAAFAGGAYAATQNSGPSTRQAFLNDVAKRLHVTPQQLSAALNGATVDELQAAVKAGRLTQAQANAIAQKLKNGFPGPGLPLPIGPPIGPIGPYGPGSGLGGPGPYAKPYAVPVPGPAFGRGPAFGLGFAGGFGALPAAANYLGLTTPQLFQQLVGGKSLAQIATAKGKSVSGLEQAMTAAERKQLDQLVTHKVITKAMENAILSKWSASLSARVNGKGLAFPGAKGFFRGSPGRPPYGYGPSFRLPAPGYPKPPAPGELKPPPGNLPSPSKPSAPPAGLPAVPYTLAPAA